MWGKSTLVFFAKPIAVLGVLYSLSLWLFPASNRSTYHRQEVAVIAHQGGNLERPDSTFIAFDHAIDVGADILEMDLHLTRDGEVVVLHDTRVDRTTDGQGRVRDLTLAEIKQLNAAYWWPYHPLDDVAKERVPRDLDFPYRSQHPTIPTLREMLERYPEHRFIIDLKDKSDDLREATMAIIEEYDRWSSILIASFHNETLAAVRAEYPQAMTLATETQVRTLYILHWFRLEHLMRTPVKGLAIPMRSGPINLATPRFVAAIRRTGMPLYFWTINEEEDMRKLIEMGVDGIITDRPERLQQIKQEMQF
ncbi:MAG: glycerophosphodiester phosphodiesterase [Saccharospirillum sp.]|nr:glycerophosphodiester phosphodiesterase [Saccharospirillum sp.]